MPESFPEMLARVEQMAAGGDAWDLSVADRYALGAVLRSHRTLLAALKIAQELLSRNGIVRPEIDAAIAKAEGR